MQQDINALTARMDSVHNSVYKMACDVQKLRERKKKRAPSITTKSTEEPEKKRRHDDSTEPNDDPEGYNRAV